MKKLKNIYKNVMVYLVMGKEIMQYNRIKGNYINVGYIDTAIDIIPFNLCKNIKWKLDIYEADGYYMKECSDNNKDKHVYIDEDLCYYNFLTSSFFTLGF